MENHAEDSSEPTSEGSTSTKDSTRQGRGLAKKTKDWGKRKLDVIFDDNFQVCGGEDQTKLSTQLGFFVKNGEAFPLTAESWPDIEDAVKDRIWNEVKENTDAPEGYKPYCLIAMDHLWRDWKCRVRRKYNSYNSDKDRLANRPDGVVRSQWANLVKKWGTKKSKDIAEINRNNRSKLEFSHTTGKIPLNVIKKQMADSGKPTDRLSLFLASRNKRKDEDTKRMIAKLNQDIGDLPVEDRENETEREKILINNLGKDGHGRMRCMPRGITPSMVYGRNYGVSRGENVATVRAEFEEKMHKMEEDFERRLQAEREANQLQMEAFKRELLSQLHSDGSNNQPGSSSNGSPD